ncbi:MAG TPA: sigma-70 family RNA polymerase sigma factor [Solirubrobacterales bacterium]|nr:sigma-70 family RNA polymerase sigma factor [Solirubrobacterales bacterium]
MPPPAEDLVPRLFLGPALRTQSDRRLVRLVREGYETAFEEIVRRYGAPLRRYAAAIVGGDADDVTQDSFSKALLALRRDDAEIELRPWLYRIVRNTALNDLRDRPGQAEVLAETIAGGRSPAEEAEQREELTELMTRLRALPQPQRAAIVMRELEGLSHEEIAAALGVTGGAARQAIHRARTTLRDAAGFLIPIPLLRLLIDHGAEVTAAAGAGAGAAAAGASIGGAGGGTALKAGLATALIAGSVGTGVALKEDRQKVDTSGPPAAVAAQAPEDNTAGEAGSAPVADSSSGPGGGDDDGSRSGPEDGDDGGSDRDEDRGHDDFDRRDEDRDPEDSSGPGRQGESGHGGHGSGSRSGSSSGPRLGDRQHDDDHSGPGGDGGADDDQESGGGGSGSNSGPGAGTVTLSDDDEDSSGSGSLGLEDDSGEEPDDDGIEVDSSGPGSGD